jgi:steroid delta-isomerase-like uncharacterized protein
MSEANKEIVRRVFTETFNNGNYAVVDQYVSEDYVDRTAGPEPAVGRDRLRESVAALRDAFTDPCLRVDDQIAEGNRVVTRFTVTGRHSGELFGIPATGNLVEFTGMAIERFENGRIVESWDALDNLTLLQQVGALPSFAPS